MATRVVKGLFVVAALLFVVAGILPTLKGQPLDAKNLSFAAVFLVLALALRGRRPPAPKAGPDA